MKINSPTDFRPTLAAALILVVLAAVYEVAARWPSRPEAAVATIATDSLAKLATPVADTTAVAAPAPEPCSPHPVVFSLGSRAARRPLVVRRYVGTVGGQAATAILQWQNPDSITGSFYLHRGGPAYTLTSTGPHAGRAVVLEVALDVADYIGNFAPASQWHLPARPGAVLAGTWRTATSRPQRLLLRESYAGALRYTFKTPVLANDYRVPGACDYVPEVEHKALMLLSPLAAPPALRPRLASSPTALRRRLQADRDSIDGDATASYWDEVRLNGFGLFSYETNSHIRNYGGTPDYGIESWLFDLRTGQELTIDGQLKLGYERPLRRLLTQHLLHDPALQDDRRSYGWDWRDDQGRPSSLVSLPGHNEALTLTEPGLEATYSFWTMHNTGAGGSERETVVLIPYRELRPLVRSGTPLARMLRARGLW